MDKPARDALRALLDAATKGEWRIETIRNVDPDEPDALHIAVGLDGIAALHNRKDRAQALADGRLVVAAVNALPALLDAADQAEAVVLERDRLRDVLEQVEWDAGKREYEDGERVGGTCPACRCERRRGHSINCALDAALRATGEGRA